MNSLLVNAQGTEKLAADSSLVDVLLSDGRYAVAALINTKTQAIEPSWIKKVSDNHLPWAQGGRYDA